MEETPTINTNTKTKTKTKTKTTYIHIHRHSVGTYEDEVKELERLLKEAKQRLYYKRLFEYNSNPTWYNWFQYWFYFS